MDFFEPYKRTVKGITHVAPKFKICESKDLMIRGRDFYAIWDEEKQIWSKKQDTAIKIIDKATKNYISEKKDSDEPMFGDYMWDADSGIIDKWNKYVTKQMRDNYHPLDNKIIFSNTPIKREDYSTHRLNYPLEESPITNYDELMSTLYSPDERKKLEWAIGAIVTGESTWIQKFIVIVGDPGTGKSTFFKILRLLFPGYLATINAKALGDGHSAFALEPLKNDPLIAIEDDADLSRITDNTRLNSLVSHEPMTVNEKFKAQYENVFHAFIFLGTNKDVKITDSASGLTRRLIDVTPTGNKLTVERYNEIMKQIPFELGGICYHCKKVYVNNKKKYDNYIPVRMLRATNLIYNFLEEYHEELLKGKDGCRFHDLWNSYNTYCELGKIQFRHDRQEFRNELRPYFKEYLQTYEYEPGKNCNGYFKGFKYEKLGIITEEETENSNTPEWLILNKSESIFDVLAKDYPAQYANENGTPTYKWSNCNSKLKDISTDKLHYVKVPENHIVIDFDIRNKDGQKDREANIEAARNFPPTYAEWSKSGAGIHLHYIYTGDVDKLSSVYDDNIEIKIFKGNSSLRRMLNGCNDISITEINSGLPLREEKKVITNESLSSERALRTFIKRNLNKEYHASTASSVQFIFKGLEDAYENEDLRYDVTDLRQAVLNFASNSTNQSDKCLDLVSKMKWKSKIFERDEDIIIPLTKEEKPIIFYDIEIFPNVFIVCWKIKDTETVTKMINPSAKEIENLYSNYRLIGFNNRKYDAHVMYARMMGYTIEQLYSLSQKIVSDNNENCTFSEAFTNDYADVYDYAVKKQSLKKWEIELDILHLENSYPWDEPLDQSKWDEVANYCANDVIATEKVAEECHSDFIARELLSDLSGMPIINTNRQHITKIIFGNDKKPNLVYTNLSTGESTYLNGKKAEKTNDYISFFPDYKFNKYGFDKELFSEEPTSCHSMYMGCDPSEGGYVYTKPGMYYNVVTFDVASLHPSSIIALNKFGDYTKRYAEIKQARIFIKHKEYEKCKGMLDGKLDRYLTNKDDAKNLANALKLILNSTYGFCSAKFDNPFKDPRDVDNIVAKRGALFMITLRKEVEAKGYEVIHCKTDSIKVVNPDEYISKFIFEFGKKYGYDFEIEARYKKICLVNKACYVAYADLGNGEGEWTATAAEFAHPYIFKSLFTHEPIEYKDLCETKSVKTAIYLDMNEQYPEIAELEKEKQKLEKKYYNKETGKFMADYDICERYAKIKDELEQKHNYIFVGRIGQFVPIKEGYGGGELVAKRDNKFSAVTGTKGYRWLEANGDITDEMIDKGYFRKLVDDARASIGQWGDIDMFIKSEDDASYPF